MTPLFTNCSSKKIGRKHLFLFFPHLTVSSPTFTFMSDYSNGKYVWNFSTFLHPHSAIRVQATITSQWITKEPLNCLSIVTLKNFQSIFHISGRGRFLKKTKKKRWHYFPAKNPSITCTSNNICPSYLPPDSLSCLLRSGHPGCVRPLGWTKLFLSCCSFCLRGSLMLFAIAPEKDIL